ncbi:MAG: c-type cytochrome, partial [Alphaproteobacteria bacterium]
EGSSTWRCKECHGWDYKGEDGACAKGSHYSVTTGVGGVAGTDPEAIHTIIMNDTPTASPSGRCRTAPWRSWPLFLSRGQIDTNRSIDRATKVARGNVRRGAAFYQTICAVCHGFDGRAMNFKDEKKPECIGTVAQKNPWETLHEIRFGQPGVGMIALGVLDIQDQVDILAYAQTLPAK